jgi:hypothetical protein
MLSAQIADTVAAAKATKHQQDSNNALTAA